MDIIIAMLEPALIIDETITTKELNCEIPVKNRSRDWSHESYAVQ